jgi:glycosyltransferase involved in cell wall biosynthesis
MERIRAAFVANGNARDPQLWSGTPSHMLAALERRFDIVEAVEAPWPAWYRPAGRALKALSGRRFEYSWSRAYSGLAARRTIARLRSARPEVVFAVSVTDMAYLLAEQLPLVTITDAVMPDLIAYYDMYKRISPTAKRRAVEAERAAFERALMVHFPSRWACRSAVEKQGVPEAKVAEIAWGANMAFAARPARQLGQGPVRLLYVGGDWERKGGPIAIGTAAELARRGFDVRLDIVGCTPAVVGGVVPHNVAFHGFVDKSSAEGRARLEAFYAEATFFLLPSLAEAYGIVFAEAAHHGLPSIAYATGGVPSVVLDGRTGVLLPGGAGPVDFAGAIAGLVGAPDVYARMSRYALEDARSRLNWDIWAERLESEVRVRLGR